MSGQPDPEPWAPLIDVTEVPLAELLASDDPAIHGALERVLRDLDSRDGVISAFQSFASAS